MLRIADRGEGAGGFPLSEHHLASVGVGAVHATRRSPTRFPCSSRRGRDPFGGCRLLAQPGVAEQVATTGVRYLVWLDGGTRKTDGGGSLACAVAPGAAGCFGFGWWEKESDYQATIWDLKQSRSVGSVGANVTGTSAVIGAIVPLPFIARVQGAACNRMATQLKGFLAGTPAGGT